MNSDMVRYYCDTINLINTLSSIVPRTGENVVIGGKMYEVMESAYVIEHSHLTEAHVDLRNLEK